MLRILLLGLIFSTSAQADIMFCDYADIGSLAIRNVIDKPDAPFEESWFRDAIAKYAYSHQTVRKIDAHVVTTKQVLIDYETVDGVRIELNVKPDLKTGQSCIGPYGLPRPCSTFTVWSHQGRLKITTDKVLYDGKVGCKFQYVGI